VVGGALVRGWLYGKDSLRPIAQLDASGQIQATFVYATRANVPDTIVLRSGAVYRALTDLLGSVRLLVDVANGGVVQRLDYDEFGNVLADSNPGFQPFGFAGGLYDPDTGLVRFGARDYDAVTGRWTAKDPSLFNGGDLNLYRYAAGDPINLADVNGKDVCVHRSSQGYHHEWVSINGNPNQSYGAWPSGNPWWGNQAIQNPDLRAKEMRKPSTSTTCYQSTPEQDRQVEDWIRGNYDFVDPSNNPPYIFGFSDCRHFVDDVTDYLWNIQGNPQQGGAHGAGDGGGGSGG
jgi:RHS repeat-associated protein